MPRTGLDWLSPNFGTAEDYRNFIPEMFAFLMLSIMFLTVGWHYTKQVFGCMMVYSRFQKYTITSTDRLLIKASLFSVWGYNYFSTNTEMQTVSMQSAQHVTHVFPEFLPVLFQWLGVLLFIGVGYYIFFRRWQSPTGLPGFQYSSTSTTTSLTM